MPSVLSGPAICQGFTTSSPSQGFWDMCSRLALTQCSWVTRLWWQGLWEASLQGSLAWVKNSFQAQTFALGPLLGCIYEPLVLTSTTGLTSCLDLCLVGVLCPWLPTLNLLHFSRLAAVGLLPLLTMPRLPCCPPLLPAHPLSWSSLPCCSHTAGRLTSLQALIPWAVFSLLFPNLSPWRWKQINASN